MSDHRRRREIGSEHRVSQKVTVRCTCACGCAWTGRRVAQSERTYAGGKGHSCPECSSYWESCERKGGDGGSSSVEEAF